MSEKKNGGSGKIHFQYQKTGSYRTYFIDGAFGGITPRGLLQMQLYSERTHLPTKETLNTETKITQVSLPDGFVREVEATIIMDYPTMIQVRNWLNGKIDFFEQKFVPGKKPENEK